MMGGGAEGVEREEREERGKEKKFKIAENRIGFFF